MAQESIDIDYVEVLDSCSVSDECGSGSNPFEFLTNNGMTEIQEGSSNRNFIIEWFLSGMRQLAMDTRVVAVHKNSVSSLTAQARLRSFKLFSEAVAKKCGGNAKFWSAWYGAPKNEIKDIVSHGFSGYGAGRRYSLGVHLFPLKFSLGGVLASEMDENGLRHVLLCEVILGKMEVVPAGSNQIYPSTKEFDSGVDNLADPTRYIMWSCYMNSHIYPAYVLSVKVPSHEALRSLRNAIEPTSQWAFFHYLMAVLSRYSDPSKMLYFSVHLNDYKNQKITVVQLMENWSQLLGKTLFLAVLILYKKEVMQYRGPHRTRRDVPHA